MTGTRTRAGGTTTHRANRYTITANSMLACISTYFNSYARVSEPSTNALKRGVPSLGGMTGYRAVSLIVAITLVALLLPLSSGDSVISSEQVEILEAGDFLDDSEWTFSSSTGFSSEQAEYTIGMIANEEMSFTHSRPDNFNEHVSWASSGCTDCNATFGEADGFYSWSRGPDITMGGYDFSGLDSMEIENISLVLHFSIPDALPSDEVNIIMQNHGSDILVRTFARTLGPVNRMVSPLVIDLDDLVEWDWSKLEQTQFNIDYVSDNQGADDSEVRVDAVGLKVKFHQPWFSFENARADHSSFPTGIPVIDFSTYDGNKSGLSHSTCGLVLEDSENGFWEFNAESPPNQILGRVHVYSEGNNSIWLSTEGPDGEFIEINSGHKLNSSHSSVHIRVEVEDGCIHGARVDVNDPQLIVSGRITGVLSGLSESSSHIRFAVGSFLVHSEIMDAGQFSISVPVGHALPGEGGELIIGVATRFQWSSNGTAENTVVHISSMSISGGYEIEWDRDPFCEGFGDLELVEDEGGQIISISPICVDDITPSQQLVVSAVSSDEEILVASGEGVLLRIEPVEEASGLAEVIVIVRDESGNSWETEFSVTIHEVNDPPEIVELPGSIFIELGDTFEIEPEILDPDSEILSMSSSKSWAAITENMTILLEPVEVGEHIVRVTVTDGSAETSRNVTVFVTSKPDLLVESVEIRVSGVEVEVLENGDVVEVIGFIRNQGRGFASNVTFYCSVDGILVGTGKIDEMGPGSLKMAVCDLQILDSSGVASIIVEIDGTNSIDETIEENNILGVELQVEKTEDDDHGSSAISAIVVISLMAIFISLAAFQLGPKSVKREFERRK